MERLTWTAWRAFWVGLGAAAVLVTQSLVAAPAGAVLAPVEPMIATPSAMPVAQATAPQVRALARPNTSKTTARLRLAK